MKIERIHWRNYFGGLALVFLFVEGVTGILLSLFYEPTLDGAYDSIKVLYRGFPAIGAWIRDSHRWSALLLFCAILVHVLRSLVRRDFLVATKRIRTLWVAGVLLIAALGLLLLTGFVLPWEWKAYWTMEMISNYFGAIPLVGSAFEEFLVGIFTLSRNFVAHVVILPVVALFLLDMHLVGARRRTGGVSAYLFKHSLLSLPFLAAAAAVAILVPMPTSDPIVVPSQFEGEGIPAPEWMFLILVAPYLGLGENAAFAWGFLLPAVFLVGLVILPYHAGKERRRTKTEDHAKAAVSSISKGRLAGLARSGKVRGVGVVVAVAGLAMAAFGGLYSQVHVAPVMGCSSCHNVARGNRMGKPPSFFKDRTAIPHNDDPEWLVKHYYFPQKWSERTTKKPRPVPR